MGSDVIYSVSAFSSLLKEMILKNFSTLKVQGEISSFIAASSGHYYFDLKEDNPDIKPTSIVKVTIWRPIASQLAFLPKNGDHVIITGIVQIYNARSTYQINAKDIHLAGQGRLMEQFLLLKENLLKKGYFDQKNKKTLPVYPKVIGLITSLKGAVIQDMLHRFQGRYPLVKLYLFPVVVQGEGSVESITHAIQYFQHFRTSDKKPIDFIIIARGGGSLEDLWTFNEEALVYAVYKSSIPIVSAIGHETDFTLIDFVSDLRAPTPTAAVELTTPNAPDLLQKLDGFQQQLLYFMEGKIQLAHSKIRLLDKDLEIYRESLYQLDQQLDDVSTHMFQILQSKLAQHSLALQSVWEKLQDRSILIYDKTEDHMNMEADLLNHRYTQILNNYKQHINHMESLLQSYAYTNVLKRGFSMVQLEKQKEIELFEKKSLPQPYIQSYTLFNKELKKYKNELNVKIIWYDGSFKTTIKKH